MSHVTELPQQAEYRSRPCLGSKDSAGQSEGQDMENSMCNERRVTSKQKTKIKASGICAQNQTRKEFPLSRKLAAGN